MHGQVLVRPQMEIMTNSQAAKNGDCYFGTGRSFRVPLDASQLHVGASTLQWTVGPRPVCATGQWWWDGFDVKGRGDSARPAEIGFDQALRRLSEPRLFDELLELEEPDLLEPDEDGRVAVEVRRGEEHARVVG